MKRILCGALAAAMLMPAALAYQVPHVNETGNIITHPDMNCDPEAQAEMLQKLGLFMGTDKGFELDRAMTRAEGAAMLCRFLGGAAEAEKGGFSHPFSDVPAWADNSVGWLYQKKLTYGVSSSQYGASQPLTAEQFAAFLSRALDGDDSRKDWYLTDEEKAALEGKPFLRSYAVAMSVRALSSYGEATGESTFAQWLVDKGLFTAEQFADAALDVMAPWFNGSEATVARVVYARCEPEMNDAQNSLGSPLPYFYATRQIGSELEYYQVDWRTLETVTLGRVDFPGDGGYTEYLGTVGGRDYLMQVRSKGDDRFYSVFSSDKTDLKLELSETDLGAEAPKKVESADAIVLQSPNATFRMDGSGISKLEQPEAAGESKVLFTGKTAYVLQTSTAQGVTIASIDQKTGEVLKSFSVAQDVDSSFALQWQETDGDQQLLYGDAGMYHFNVETGELVQVTDTPVVGVTPRRASGTVYYLAHTPGKYFRGMNKMGGNLLIRVDHTTGEQTMLIDESAQLEISDFNEENVPSGSLEFYSAADVGMQHFNMYTYLYDLSTGKITVKDYQAGRPEVENGWDYNNPEAYKKAYIEEEQARLDASWNSRQ